MSTGTNRERIEQNNTLLEDIKTQIQNLPESGGSGGVKQFSTIEEMQSDTTAKEGDMAVVYRSEMQNATVDSHFQVATFPDTVVLDTALTDYVEVRYRAVDSSKMFDCWGQLDSSMFSMECYTESGEVRIQYTSSDGITYTRTDTTGNPVDFGTEIYYERTEYWNDAIGKFIQVGGNVFEGLFRHEYDKKGEFDLVIDAMSNVSYNGSEFTYENGHISIPSALYKRLSSMYEEYCIQNNVSADYKTFNVHFFQTDSDSIYVSFLDGDTLDLVNIGDGFRLCMSSALNSTTTSASITKTYYKYNISNDTYETLSVSVDTSVYYKYTHSNGYTSIFYSDVIFNGTLLSNTGVYMNTTTADIRKNRDIRLLSINSSHSPISEKVLSSLNVEKLYLISHYNPAPTQLSAITDCVYSKEFYGKNGVETGTLAQDISNSFTDMSAEVYGKIQNYYDNLEPRVLTDSDKTIDKSIRYIPTKSDGTPLLNTSSVTNMRYMFQNCTNLTTIPLLNTSSATNMESMFQICTNLTTISQLDTSSVTDMESMFSGCTNLTTIPLLDTSSVTNMTTMFHDCTNLTEIPQLDTSSVTGMQGMFWDCTNLTTIPLLDTSNVTSMYEMFSGCTNLTEIPQLNTSKVTNMNYMFANCTNLTTIPLLSTSNATTMEYMFASCTNLTEIPLLNTSNVTAMNSMFASCTNLTTIPQLNTSKVTSMNYMFQNCTNLTEIPQLDTSNATSMIRMFNDCTNLTTIPQLNTSKVTDMRSMFGGCTNLTTIPLLNTSKVVSINNMFDGCMSLTDESLNNILAMCKNAIKVTSSSYKTLAYIGLTSAQANKCKTLSNYSRFTAAGWTTGY